MDRARVEATGRFRSRAAWALRVAAVALLALGAGITVRPAGEPSAEAGPASAVRHRDAFDFQLTDINPESPSFGESVRLRELVGRRGLVLNFIASWCTPCRQELPGLQSLHAAGRVDVACVAADEYGGPDGLSPLIRKAGLTMPVLFAPEAEAAEIAEHYTYTFLPATYLIDAAGKVRSVHEGLLPTAELHNEIDKHLGPDATHAGSPPGGS